MSELQGVRGGGLGVIGLRVQSLGLLELKDCVCFFLTDLYYGISYDIVVILFGYVGDRNRDG